jgi:two-component system LytT family response regulator
MPDTSSIRCLIVDDEPPARDVLRRYIEEVPTLQLCGSCANAIEAMGFLQQNSVDLMFLDIQMPQLKGNELLRILSHPPHVIFTTAHPEYAVEGYELDAVDFLLKPIHFDRFLKSVSKAFQLSRPVAAAVPASSPATALPQEAFIYVRADRKMIRVILQDILYVESMKDYVKVVTTSGTHVTKQSITAMEAMLPEYGFVRMHRSFIVSLSKIHSYTNEEVEVDKVSIPIGKLYRHQVIKLLG